MFNRGAESQNISQFIKGGIAEEEDQEDQDSEALEISSSSNLKSASGLHGQTDEMFFQMDKGECMRMDGKATYCRNFYVNIFNLRTGAVYSGYGGQLSANVKLKAKTQRY